MDISLIFVIVIMFYFCVIFPLQMRRYIMIRGQRQNTQRPQTRNAPAYARSVLRRNNDTSSREQSDNHIVFSVSQHSSPSCTESQSDEATEAARHLEAEHRQQIIEIQREIEQQAVRRREESSDPNAPHLPPRIINSSTVRNPVAEYSQQIIEVQREIERQAIQRREEQRSAANPHMPPRLINISIIRSSIYTIPPDSTGNAEVSDVNYPYAPPLTPDEDREMQIHFTHRSNSRDDELPSYEQAVAINSTISLKNVNRF